MDERVDGTIAAVGVAGRAGGALVGTFVGDALGMPFEGLSQPAIPEDVEMVAARRGRGRYTDDTQTMIALAGSLIARGRVNAEHLARAYSDAYVADRGYGAGTQRMFELWSSGVPIAGAAGRLFGGQGAVVQAAAIGAALRGEHILAAVRSAAKMAELRDALDEIEGLLGDTRTPAEVQVRLGSSAEACASVAAALYSALAHDRFDAAVRFAVRLGGDSDTVAPMAGAVAGARGGYRSIPTRSLEALENGDRGRSPVQTLTTPLIRGG